MLGAVWNDLLTTGPQVEAFEEELAVWTGGVTCVGGGSGGAALHVAYAAARRFRSHGMVREAASMLEPEVGGWHQEVHSFGLNYGLSDVLCALGRSRLRRLSLVKARRSELVDRYMKLLDDVPGLRLPV